MPLFVLGALKHTALVENLVERTGGVVTVVDSPTYTNHVPWSPQSPALNMALKPSSRQAGEDYLGPISPVSARVFEQRRLLCCPLSETMRALYPRTYSLLDVLDDPALSDEIPFSPRNTHSSLSFSPSSPSSVLGLSLSPPPSSPRNNHCHGGSSGFSRPSAVSPAPFATQSLSLPRSPLLSAALRAVQTQRLLCSSEILDSERILLLDDGSVLWLAVGRAVSREILGELFVANATGDVERSSSVTIRQTSALGRRLHLFLHALSVDCAILPGQCSCPSLRWPL
jgi:hypothetical protein